MAQNTIVFTDNLAQVLSSVSSQIEMALVKMGAACQSYAKDNTPVRTGTLRDSIGVEVNGDEQEVLVGTMLDKFPQDVQPYGKYVELGSRGRQGVHMLQRAVTEHAGEYKKIFEKEMRG